VTWFKVDDQLAFHPKILACTPTAIALWVRAGAWSAGHLTDGALPTHIIRTLGAQRRDAERLVAVGLWERTDSGYQFHDWADWQPTKAQVEQERERTRERVKAHRNARRNAVTTTVTNGVSNGGSTPAPTRPDLKEQELTTYAPRAPRSAQPSEAKAHRLPDDWEPSLADVEYARLRGVDERRLPDVIENFRAHWLNKPGKDGRKINWSMTWQTWIRNEQKWATSSNGHGNGRAVRSGAPNWQHTFADGTPMPWDR
jgi:hypothetical protein